MEFVLPDDLGNQEWKNVFSVVFRHIIAKGLPAEWMALENKNGLKWELSERTIGPDLSFTGSFIESSLGLGLSGKVYIPASGDAYFLPDKPEQV